MQRKKKKKKKKITIVNYGPKRQRFYFFGALGHIPVGKRPLHKRDYLHLVDRSS